MFMWKVLDHAGMSKHGRQASNFTKFYAAIHGTESV